MTYAVHRAESQLMPHLRCQNRGIAAGDDTFYGSYTPEADIKDVEEELADE